MTDIDECQTGLARCRDSEVCLNHAGGYRCRVIVTTQPPPPSCPPGHRLDTLQKNCEGGVKKIITVLINAIKLMH